MSLAETLPQSSTEMLENINKIKEEIGCLKSEKEALHESMKESLMEQRENITESLIASFRDSLRLKF